MKVDGVPYKVAIVHIRRMIPITNFHSSTVAIFYTQPSCVFTGSSLKHTAEWVFARSINNITLYLFYYQNI